MKPNLLTSLYLHFPFCRHLCNYCDFYKQINTNPDATDFERYLENSWVLSEELLKHNQYEWGELNTFYIGGGTPSLWGEKGPVFLSQFFQDKGLRFKENAEITIEVNPGSWTKESLEAFQKFGVNRYSLGIQSMSVDCLKDLDRVHSRDDVFETLKYFHESDYNFSVDLMLGLPFSTKRKRNIIAELDEILNYEPDHFSVYILTTKKNYIHSDYLPMESFIEEEYLSVANYLKARGYLHYEVSNFSKPKKESRHNLSYWKSKSVGALGPSATGYLSEVGVRYKWKVSTPEYQLEELTKDEVHLESWYLALRTNLGLKIKEITTHKNEILKIKEKLRTWHYLGLAQDKEEEVILTSKGMLTMDSIINEIFSVLK